jgi:hypothetical protein
MTIGRDAALKLAERDIPEGIAVDGEAARELPSGWFVPYRSINGQLVGGGQGVIVNKRTGKLFRLGSAFPVQRDIDLYERGYQFESYDLVILEIADFDGTLRTLEELKISIVEPTWEGGTVWRIPRRLTRDELRDRLAKMPAVFGELRLYFDAEALERARTTGAFRCELLECRT